MEYTLMEDMVCLESLGGRINAADVFRAELLDLLQEQLGVIAGGETNYLKLLGECADDIQSLTADGTR